MTEICVQIDGNIEEIKKVVLSHGFEFLEAYNNYDTYYTSLPKNEIMKVSYKDLLDNSLIIRNIKGENFDIKNIVYKKKTLDKNGNVTNEIKTKVKIDNIENIKTIFNNIKLNCWCDYINNNNEYKKGEIILNIQYVKELGTFIEIEEFESIKDKSDDEKFSILMEIINAFGFPLGKDYSCKKPYMILHPKSI